MFWNNAVLFASLSPKILEKLQKYFRIGWQSQVDNRIQLNYFLMYVIMYVEELTKIDMKINRTLSITEARKEIFKIADELQKPDVCYMLTENGKPKVVMMSAEEYESWMETIEVMREMPDLAKEIKEAEEEFAKGEYVKFEDILKEDGIEITDKGEIKHVSNCSKKVCK